MTRTQLLSVPREKLDRISPEYLDQMASEGVLIFDGQKYGFGHESFFDYCFARGFVSKISRLLICLLPPNSISFGGRRSDKCWHIFAIMIGLATARNFTA